MNWQDVNQYLQAAFEDGELIDLYILDVNMEVWQSALNFLRLSHFQLNYVVDTHEAELPTDVASIFSKGQEANIFLKVNVSGITVVFHFFDDEEIGFDIAARDVDSEAKFNSLCDFVRGLGKHLERTVILTTESSPDRVIIRYLPSEDQFVYTPLPLYAKIETLP